MAGSKTSSQGILLVIQAINHTWPMKKAQEMLGFTLISHSKEAQESLKWIATLAIRVSSIVLPLRNMQMFEINALLKIEKERFDDMQSEQMRNRFLLVELLLQNPQSYLVLLQGFHYRRLDGVFFIFFSPEAKDIIVTECSDHLQQCEDKYTNHFLTLITSLEGKQCIFQFHFNPSSKASPVDFIFDNILNQTRVSITQTFDKLLALMANFAKESSRSSTTIVEKLSDISTSLVVPKLHLVEKSSISILYQSLGVTLVWLGKVKLDNSTNNVLIPLDSWTSGLLEYKLSLSKPLAENHDKPVESNEILTNDQPQKTNEPDAQPSNKIQTPPIPFPRRLRKEKRPTCGISVVERLLIRNPIRPRFLYLKIRRKEERRAPAEEFLEKPESSSTYIAHVIEALAQIAKWNDHLSGKPYPVVQETTEPVKLVREHLYSASANEIDEKKPELKDLPNHLEYTYLHGKKSFPIIISSELSDKEKSSLLQVL
ncbi:hypothetical protein Tco_1292072 [Tanacetum coccineum]